MLLPGRVYEGCVACRPGLLTLLEPQSPSGDVAVMVRPEQIRLGGARRGAPTARVVGTVFHGHDAGVSLILEGETPGLAVTAGRGSRVTPRRSPARSAACPWRGP